VYGSEVINFNRKGMFLCNVQGKNQAIITPAIKYMKIFIVFLTKQQKIPPPHIITLTPACRDRGAGRPTLSRQGRGSKTYNTVSADCFSVFNCRHINQGELYDP
jgi:hypothetical protein